MRPDLKRVPEFYHNYVNHTVESNVMDAFRNQTPVLLKFLQDIPKDKRDYRYGPDKWTIKEVLQHIIDAERVFAYRALCFSRKDSNALPGFDENDYAANAKADKRNWDDMMEEFKATRRSNELLFASFDDEQLDSTGTASGKTNYVSAWGFIMVGHINHHVRILKERYL